MNNNNVFYGRGLPYVKPDELIGRLITIEGPDCSGRTTHVELIKEWLEYKGYAVLNTGLRRSTLVGDAISKAKQGNILGKTTLSLLYCTDFADQLENKIIPALKAGFIVLADRYIFTLMARDIVRGASKEWLKGLLEFALVPDIVFYLNVRPETLLHRSFAKYGQLDYWESGMDANFSSDMLESFIKYHCALEEEYRIMANEYNFNIINGEDTIESVQNQFRKEIAEYLKI